MEDEQSQDLAPEDLGPVEEDEDEQEEIDEEKYENNLDIQDDYAAPEAEEKLNQYAIMDKAIKAKDTVRTTFLNEQELGRPLFSVRFYGTYRDLARHYLDVELDQLGFDAKRNIVKEYFNNKIQNITDSGMSNRGFTMNLSVTQKRDVQKKRIREVHKDGGKVKS